jgi:fumarate reductase subunit C
MIREQLPSAFQRTFFETAKPQVFILQIVKKRPDALFPAAWLIVALAELSFLSNAMVVILNILWLFSEKNRLRPDSQRFF